VSKELVGCVLAIFMLRLAALPALAAPDPALSKELIALIVSQALPCGKIVKIDTQADRDYLVTCQNESSYEINSDAQGKLVVHSLGQKIH
jgi:hypothetical protein